MRAVMVRYTVREEYVEQNRAHIRSVMVALRERPIEGMRYASFTLDDGRTFVHVNMAKDQDTLSALGGVPEFRDFQAALKASEPVSPPEATDLHLVDAAFTL